MRHILTKAVKAYLAANSLPFDIFLVQYNLYESQWEKMDNVKITGNITSKRLREMEQSHALRRKAVLSQIKKGLKTEREIQDKVKIPKAAVHDACKELMKMELIKRVKRNNGTFDYYPC